MNRRVPVMSWIRDDSSSGNSDVDLMGGINDESGNDEPIEFIYDPERFESIQPDPNFVNQGEAEWQKRRKEWASNESADNDETPYFDVDVEETMIALHEYKPFPEPVRLDIMIEILQVLWEEDGI